jgi:Protein of unknown function (DUF3089)
MRRRVSIACACATAFVLTAAACSSGDDSSSGAAATPKTSATITTTTTVVRRDLPPLPASYADYHSAVYAKPESWLCRGDERNDVCDTEMDATVVQPDGSANVEKFTSVADAPVDCFYVYPTISNDPTQFSDMTPSPTEEEYVVRQQAARLGTECRVFAPIYRQLTRPGLAAALTGRPTPGGPVVSPYNDVLDAFKQYMANDNDGRGVVLVGHSQGASLLLRLLQNEIDPNPSLRARLVSAVIPGTTVQVPPGADVGGALKNIPVCRADDQTGCVVAYSTFLASAPPPANAYFGRVRRGDDVAACTNPAALSGGSAKLHPYFGTHPRGQTTGGEDNWVKGVTITTPFVAFPDQVAGQCVERDGASYLALTTPPSGQLANVVNGATVLGPQWGTHLVDVNIEMGDIVTMVGHQIAAYTKK